MTQENESDHTKLSDQTKAEMKAGKVSLAKHEANQPKTTEPELPPDPDAGGADEDTSEHMPTPEPEPVEEFKATPPAFTMPLKKKK